MDKFAQQRSRRSKALEYVNLPGQLLESRHEHLSDAMDKIREVDAEIRSAAEDVRPAIRNARSALRRRDYLDAGYNVTSFHERCRRVSFILNKFVTTGKIEHFDYILDNFDKSDDLFSYNPNAEISLAALEFENLVKESGIKDKLLTVYDYIGDTAHNLITPEGLSKGLMEKRFNTDFVKILKKETTDIVAKSNKMLGKLLNIFSTLESGVSRRSPRLYVAKAKEFIKEFDKYHTDYMKFDEKVLEPLRAHRTAKSEKLKKEKETLQQAELEKQQALEKQMAEQKAAYEQEQKELAEAQQFLTPHKDVALPEYEEPSLEEFNKRKQEENRKAREKTLYKLHQQDDELDSAWDEEDVDLTELNSVPKGSPSPLKVKPEKENDNLDIPSGKVPMGRDFSPSFNPKNKNKAIASHNVFIEKLESYASKEDVGSFVNNLLNYSEELELTDPQSSANLLMIAQNIISDYKKAGIFDKLDKLINKKDKAQDAAKPKAPKQEFQRLSPTSQDKPQELIDEEENRFKVRKIDIPDGAVDKSYRNIDFLSGITPERIIITQATATHLRNIIVDRIMTVLKLDSYDPRIEFDKNFISAFKNSIYNGWVVQSTSVQDDFNPRDKYLEIFTRLNLADLDSKLVGIAKLYIVVRVSANKSTVTVKNAKKHFVISNLKEIVQPVQKPKPVINEPSPITRRSPDSLEEFDENGDEIFDEPIEYDNE